MFATRLRCIAAATVIAVAVLGPIGLSAPAASAAPCAATVPGDINGDGHADQAIGEPGDADFAGAVHVLYGTGKGLVADASGSALDGHCSPRPRLASRARARTATSSAPACCWPT